MTQPEFPHRTVCRREKTSKTSKPMRTISAGLLVLLSLPSQIDAAQWKCKNYQGADPVTIYLVTMQPGQALFTGFGHVALRVVNRCTGEDVAYDYGTYDADDPLLIPKFFTGSLQYFCSKSKFEDMLEWYSKDFGGITIRKLNLPPDKVIPLVNQLEHDAQPQHAAYRYHHFHNNCSTKIRDLLDKTLGGKLQAQTEQPAGVSFRDLINASLNRWWQSITRWAVFGLLGADIDQEITRWQQAFLPYFLAQELDKITLTDAQGQQIPLVAWKKVLFGHEEAPPIPPHWWPGLVFILILGLIGTAGGLLALSGRKRLAFLTSKTVLTTGLTIAGIYGTIIVVGFFIAPYPELQTNWNLALFHPLHFLGAYLVRQSHSQKNTKLYLYLIAGICISSLLLLAELLAFCPQTVWPYSLACIVFSVSTLWSFSKLSR